jgi:hypothetical protein
MASRTTQKRRPAARSGVARAAKSARQSPLTRQELERLFGTRVADHLILFFGGRTIPKLRYEEAQRYARDQEIRRHVDRTGATYKATAARFGVSIDTVKRVCREPLIEPWAARGTAKAS